MNSIEKISNAIFTLPSIAVHVAAIGAWELFVDNSELGTLLLSVEAIFITLLVGIAVRREGAREAEHVRQMLRNAQQDNDRIIDLLED